MNSILQKNHLTFFVDPKWFRQMQYTPLLYPFWGNPLDAERRPFVRAMFEHHPFNTEYYSITNKLEEADMILVPYRHRFIIDTAPDIWEQCITVSKQTGKPLLIDGVGDVEHFVSVQNALVLRYGGYRFSRTGNEIIIPVYTDDLLEVYCNGRINIRQKSIKPSIGFAGWSSLSLYQTARTIIKELPVRIHGMFDDRYNACKKGVFFRAEATKILEASSKIVTHFIKRPSFSGHSDTASDDPNNLRREMVDILLASDYGLDVRGDANASMRLYEILSLGRIPVIIDTERNFPFENEIDYSTFSLRVDFRDLYDLPNIIADFHSKLTREQFVLMQKNARAVYLNHFRIDVIMPHIVREIIYWIQKNT